MSQRSCKQCGTSLSKDACFCPQCGIKAVTTIICTCGKTNSAEAAFCQSCGKALLQLEAAATLAESSQRQIGLKQKILSWYTEARYAKALLIGSCAFVIALLAGYFYIFSTQESQYLLKYGEASRKISTANEVLISNLKQQSLNAKDLSSVKTVLTDQKGILENIEKEFSSQRIPSKYTEQHQVMSELLRLENSLVQQILLALDYPLRGETDNVLITVKSNLEEAKLQAAKIQIPDGQVAFTGEWSVLPHELTLYVENRRQANKEKLEKLAAATKFFQKMDEVLQQYNGAKTDLGGLLENLRKGGYTWNDYFQALDQARFSRSSLRSQVTSLTAPAGAEGLKQELLEVLSDALLYCNLMRAAANIEFQTSYYVAESKYKEAKTVNDRIQQRYGQFSERYNQLKNQMLNPDGTPQI